MNEDAATTRVLGYRFIVKFSLISSEEGKLVFSIEVMLPTTPGQVTCSGVVVQHIMDSQCLCAFISYSLAGSDFSWMGERMLLFFDWLGEVLLFCLLVLK